MFKSVGRFKQTINQNLGRVEIFGRQGVSEILINGHKEISSSAKVNLSACRNLFPVNITSEQL